MYPATIDEAIETFPQPKVPGERKQAFIHSPHPIHGGPWHIAVFVAQTMREKAALEWVFRRAVVDHSF